MKSFLSISLTTVLAVLITNHLHDYYKIPGLSSLPGAGIARLEEAGDWSAFFDVFGVMYAILAGFLLLRVLDRFTSLSQAIEGELNSVQDARDLLVYFGEDQYPQQRKIVKELSDYLKLFTGSEWRQMRRPRRRRRDHVMSDTTEELWQIMREVKDLRCDDECDRFALRSLIQKMSDLTSYRTSRVGLAYDRLPSHLKFLLALVSVVLIGAFIVLQISHPVVHLAIIASMTAVIHLVYAIIADLDHPFAGTWNVSKAPMEEAKKRFADELEDIREDAVEAIRNREVDPEERREVVEAIRKDVVEEAQRKAEEESGGEKKEEKRKEKGDDD